MEEAISRARKFARRSEAINNNTLNRLVIQIIFCVCIMIGIIICNMLNKEAFNEFLSKYGWVVTYDMKYENTYNKVMGYINKKFEFKIPLIEIAEEINNTKFEKSAEDISGLPIVQNVADNSLNNVIVIDDEKQIDSYDKMKSMATEIKNKYTLAIPTMGVITCPFGNRESTSEGISEFHLGLDIANNVGTNIYASLDGKVITVARNSIYGNYLKIEQDDIVIIYAHCNKIVVKEGQLVKQKQKIAEMGQTGLATGPHLHLEIRKDGNVIDPQYLIEI